MRRIRWGLKGLCVWSVVWGLNLVHSAAADAQSFPSQYANLLRSASYTVYAGDINGDGIIDVLLLPKRSFVLIDYDVPFPVLLKPKSPPFLLQSGSGTYSLTVNPSASIQHSAVWQPNTYTMSFGDTLGTGSVSMLLQPLSAGRPSFLIATSAASGLPVLLENLTTNAIGADLSAAGTVVSLQDINWDGRADLVVYSSGQLSAALTAAPDGTFALPPASAGGSALAAWRALCAALTLGDVQSAQNLLTSTARPQYASALSALGATSTVTTITKGWSEPSVIFSTPDLAEFTVTQTEAGVLKLHYVTVLNEFGNWAVESF